MLVEISCFHYRAKLREEPNLWWNSRPQLYAIWSVSIFPERLSRKCVGLNPKRRRVPIRLQKLDVDPGFTTPYLYNSTLQVMVGTTFVKCSLTGVKGFHHTFLPNLLSIPQCNALSLSNGPRPGLIKYMASDVPKVGREAHRLRAQIT